MQAIWNGAVLAESDRVAIGSPHVECAVVVASGEVELVTHVPRRLEAFGAIRLDPGAAVELQATASPTLLFAVEART